MILTAMVIADAPTCNTPNHAVMMVKAGDLTYPNSARNLGPVTILVKVAVNADGSVDSAEIFQSSNNAALDLGALRAARQSQYSPMTVNCVSQNGTATLTIDMVPGGGGSINVASTVQAGSAACPTPNREAAIIEEVQPDLSGLESHVTGPTSVTVRVNVDPNGRPGDVTVVSSSGDRLLDDAVIRAARLSKYTPRFVDCKAVEGDYILLESLH
jgi:TonB family protein